MTVLTFDQARAQIESGAAAVLSRAPAANINAALPTVELVRGKTTVTCGFEALGAADLFVVVDKLKPYFRQLTALRTAYRGVSFQADLCSDSERRRAAERRIKQPDQPELPPPLDVAFQVDPKGPGTIKLELSDGRSGRELEDACGVAERMWASALVASGAVPTPPPLERYVEGFRLEFVAASPR